MSVNVALGMLHKKNVPIESLISVWSFYILIDLNWSFQFQFIYNKYFHQVEWNSLPSPAEDRQCLWKKTLIEKIYIHVFMGWVAVSNNNSNFDFFIANISTKWNISTKGNAQGGLKCGTFAVTSFLNEWLLKGKDFRKLPKPNCPNSYC